MKLFCFFIFFGFYSFSSFALEYSCIDKKYKNLSKMNVEDKLIKYQDEKGSPAEYQVIEDSDTILMGISKGKKETDPMINYIFIIKDKSLAYNSILRSIKVSYNEIYSENITLKCIGAID